MWKEWKDVNDHLNFYIYRVKGHSVLVLQHPDNETNAIKCDLIVDEANKVWKIRMRETKWKPEDREVTTTKTKWHLAAQLKAMKASADELSALYQ